MANFFCVKEDKLLTPQLSESILSGVTRSSVIQLAREDIKYGSHRNAIAD